MISRRHFLQAGLATTALWGLSAHGNWGRLAAQQALAQDGLIGDPEAGDLTLVHITDIHAQTQPIWFREPSINLGVGSVEGLPPHLTGADFRRFYGIEQGSPMDYALTADDFVALGREYGRMGGADRISTVVKTIREQAPGAILLDGGDTWQGSLPALRTNGADMVKIFNALGTEAMTSHWEFTLGIDRVTQIVENELNFPFLGANIFDAMWDEPAYEPMTMFERNGTSVAVIGQAFPYLPIANPSYMFPDLSFGIRPERMAEVVQEARDQGAEVVVVLSHNGFDVDRKMASVVPGIDVILTGHTHDALPAPVQIGNTFLIASGSHGKFVSRVDIDVEDGRMKDLRHRLIPIFSDVIAPDAEMTALVGETRAPFAEEMAEVIGRADSLLYRRGNFNGTWDDLICEAMLEERDAEIALSPGFRWGASVMPGQDITREDIFNATSMSYPEVYRTEMTGEYLKVVLEDVADNLFNPDPFYQQGGDMVRVGGLGYRIDITQPQGSRLSDLTLLSSGEQIDPARTYVVAGWASVNEGTEGPPIWDVVENYIRSQGTVSVPENTAVAVKTE